jgi:hypothetical protein
MFSSQSTKIEYLIVAKVFLLKIKFNEGMFTVN